MQAQAANNYLLDHQPRLVELLADMPQLLVHENVQLLAEVQVRSVTPGCHDCHRLPTASSALSSSL